MHEESGRRARRFRTWLLTPVIQRLDCIERKMEELMKQVEDFEARQKARNEALAGGLGKIKADIKVLDDKITAFQNSPGTLSPEDQKRLDDLETTSQALLDSVTAIDEQHPDEPIPE